MWRPRVCNQVWKGKRCPNRNNGCRFAHPTPCSNDHCRSGPSQGCKAFHPPTSGKGNGKGSVRRGGAAPKKKNNGKNGSNKSRKPNAKRSAPSNGRAGGSAGNSGNGSSKSIAHQLGERVEMMERQLGLGRERLSYRDVAARGLNARDDGGSPDANTNIPSIGSRPIGRRPPGFGHVQPDPAMLSTVVAAVMAVLAGGHQHHF